MADRTFLNWPFFEDRHRKLAEELEAWAAAQLAGDHSDTDAACRALVRTGRGRLDAAFRRDGGRAAGCAQRCA